MNVSVVGVTDPDGDPVAITVTRITQDEPVSGQGSGDTGPDGAGVGTSTASIRSERAGGGDGRAYEISFRADDGKGGSRTSGQSPGALACACHGRRAPSASSLVTHAPKRGHAVRSAGRPAAATASGP